MLRTVAFAIVLATSTLAFAQEPAPEVIATPKVDDLAEARAHLEDLDLSAEQAKQFGTLFFERGENETAIKAWRNAQRLQPEPSLWIAIAEAQNRLGDLDGEKDSLQRYLLSTLDAKDRPALESRIEAIDTQMQEAALAVPMAEAIEEKATEPALNLEQPRVAKKDRRKAAIVATSSLAAAALVTATVTRFVAFKKDDSKRNDTIAIFSDFTFGVAAVSGVSALVLHLQDRKAKRKKERSLRLLPVVGPKHALLHASYRF